jgi:hypothetical protein
MVSAIRPVPITPTICLTRSFVHLGPRQRINRWTTGGHSLGTGSSTGGLDGERDLVQV